MLYSDLDAWECKLCVFSEKISSEKKDEIVYLCHKNRFKYHEEQCQDRKTNEQLVKKINKEKPHDKT